MGDLQRLIQNQEKNSNSENLGQHLLFNNPLSYKSIQTSIHMPAKKKINPNKRPNASKKKINLLSKTYCGNPW